MNNIMALANLEALLHNRILWALDCNDFLREDSKRVEDHHKMNELILKTITDLIQELKIIILMNVDDTVLYVHGHPHSPDTTIAISVKNYTDKFISFSMELHKYSFVSVSNLILSEETNKLVLEKLSKLFYLRNTEIRDCIGTL